MTIWKSSDDKEFVITAIYRDPTDGRCAGTWVHYRNKKTGQEYNCLYDAFMARFTKFDV
jgi:hypothetical protein